MITRLLPPSEWPRLRETGSVVDQSWADRAIRGYVVTVESGPKILGTAFVFLAGDDRPHVDGLWIETAWRGKLTVLRQMHRGVKYAVEQLGGGSIPIESAVWMTRSERRSEGVVL